MKVMDDMRNVAQSVAQRIQTEVRDIDKDFRALPDDMKLLVQRVMTESTNINLYPHNDGDPRAEDNRNSFRNVTPTVVKNWQQLNASWNQLSPEAQSVYDDTIKFTKEVKVKERAALMVRATQSFGLQEAADLDQSYKVLLDKFLSVKGAKGLNILSKELKAKIEASDVPLMEDKDVDMMVDVMKKVTGERLMRGPFIPNRRFGDYTVTGRMAAQEKFNTLGEAQEAKRLFEYEAGAKDAEIIGTTVYYEAAYFNLAEDLYEAQQEAERMKALGWTMDEPAFKLKPNETAVGSIGGMAKRLTRDLYQGEQTEETKKLRMHMEVMIMEMLAGNSLRQSKLHRKGIAGIDPSLVFRGVSEYGMSASHQIADIQSAGIVDDMYSLLKRQTTAKGAEELEGKQPDAKILEKRGHILYEMNRREEQAILQRRSTAGSIIGKAGFAYFLTSGS